MRAHKEPTSSTTCHTHCARVAHRDFATAPCDPSRRAAAHRAARTRSGVGRARPDVGSPDARTPTARTRVRKSRFSKESRENRDFVAAARDLPRRAAARHAAGARPGVRGEQPDVGTTQSCAHTEGTGYPKSRFSVERWVGIANLNPRRSVGFDGRLFAGLMELWQSKSGFDPSPGSVLFTAHLFLSASAPRWWGAKFEDRRLARGVGRWRFPGCRGSRAQRAVSFAPPRRRAPSASGAQASASRRHSRCCSVLMLRAGKTHARAARLALASRKSATEVSASSSSTASSAEPPPPLGTVSEPETRGARAAGSVRSGKLRTRARYLPLVSPDISRPRAPARRRSPSCEPHHLCAGAPRNR